MNMTHIHISLCAASSMALQDVKSLDLLYHGPQIISIMVKDLCVLKNSDSLCQLQSSIFTYT